MFYLAYQIIKIYFPKRFHPNQFFSALDFSQEKMAWVVFPNPVIWTPNGELLGAFVFGVNFLDNGRNPPHSSCPPMIVILFGHTENLLS